MSTRILLVDDEPRNLALLEAYLFPFGYDLVRAGSGAEALALFEEQRPDLVLLDLLMPDLDGIDVLAHIRAAEGSVRVPVILLSGRTEREDRLSALEAGADDFLPKPVDRMLFLERVRALLGPKASKIDGA